jgi:hypothetical protein
MEAEVQYKLSQEDALILLNSFLAGFEFLSTLDRIKSLDLYKDKLRSRTRTLVSMLEAPLNKGFNEITGVEDEAMYQIMEGKKQLLKFLAGYAPEYAVGFLDLLQQFQAAPELVLHRNGIKIQ